MDYAQMCEYAEALHLADTQAAVAARPAPSSCIPFHFHFPSLPSVNPYKSVIPFLGFFDISVIVKALETKSKGKLSGHITASSDIDLLDLPCPFSPNAGLRGFIVNVRQESLFPGFSSRHWFSVLRLLGGPYTDAGTYTDHPEGKEEASELLHSSDVREMVTAAAIETEGRAHAYRYEYWNMDSKLPRPLLLQGVQGGGEALQKFLKQMVEQHAAQIFVVTAPLLPSPT